MDVQEDKNNGSNAILIIGKEANSHSQYVLVTSTATNHPRLYECDGS